VVVQGRCKITGLHSTTHSHFGSSAVTLDLIDQVVLVGPDAREAEASTANHWSIKSDITT
jgi:predicted benzoate:H+ symporter BenE